MDIGITYIGKNIAVGRTKYPEELNLHSNESSRSKASRGVPDKLSDYYYYYYY